MTMIVWYVNFSYCLILAVFVTNGILQIEGEKGPQNNHGGEREKANEKGVEEDEESEESTKKQSEKKGEERESSP
jgi:hypothetical protein